MELFRVLQKSGNRCVNGRILGRFDHPKSIPVDWQNAIFEMAEFMIYCGNFSEEEGIWDNPWESQIDCDEQRANREEKFLEIRHV